jgi:hypothetical protein
VQEQVPLIARGQRALLQAGRRFQETVLVRASPQLFQGWRVQPVDRPDGLGPDIVDLAGGLVLNDDAAVAQSFGARSTPAAQESGLEVVIPGHGLTVPAVATRFDPPLATGDRAELPCRGGLYTRN